ncbi:energy transducer TonB [Celeribacter sp.]|uniref:energy transducer TonB n=1 Tax=Celeribacter sp. TaxID=1890673 RepID=UPI003A8F657F
MNTGHYISGAGHLGLILYALLGGLFLTPDDSEPVGVQEVALVSEAEFAALTRANSAPEVAEQAPERTAPVPMPETAPTRRPTPDAQPDQAPAPSEPEQAEPEVALDEAAPLTPQAEVTDTPPEPQPDPELSPEETGAGLPEIANQDPTPQSVPRIAPEAVTTPEPQPEIADAPTPDVSPDAETAEVVDEDVPAAAPEEATTEIVTEAETPSGMAFSPRPQARPANLAARAAAAREQAQAETSAPAEPQEDAADAVANAAAAAAAALAAEVAGETASPATPSGPPLSAGERDALRVAVSQCWNVGALSSEALRTTITVAVAMNRDGTPVSSSLNLLGYSGGSQSAANAAFEVARRAILRCGARGFNLPVEKYDHWRNIEMTFDPEQMRFK